MTIARRLQSAKRAFEFGRHIPLTRLVRRLQLNLRRGLLRGDSLPTAKDIGCTRTDSPQGPLFPPRRGLIEKVATGWSLTFLGRSEILERARLDWRTPGLGSQHQLWRMNLHYMEYLEEAADFDWQEIVRQWIDRNFPPDQESWKDSWSGYALSLRVVVWMQQLAVRENDLPKELIAGMEQALAQQILYLELNLETDLGGNHLIKNIKALLWASAFFVGVEAARWRAKGLKLLRRELLRQVLSDGMHVERSMSYHCQVFADLLECRHALGGDPFKGLLDDMLCRMAQVVTDLTHPDGWICQFNDAGLTMAYAPEECLAAYARLFGGRPTQRRVFALDAAGYFGLRAPESYVVVDCGRIAPDDLPAHGHGDVLSFEWSVRGQRLIVDQGVFEYNAGERRQIARSAMSHNTLCLERADQADFFGAFRCGRRPNVTVRAYGERPDGFVLEGSHDGFSYLPGKPRHVRRFEIDESGMTIRDWLESAPERVASIGFLFHPGAQVDLSGDTARIICGAAEIRISSNLTLTAESSVWWPDMGREEKTTRLWVMLRPGEREAVTRFEIQPAKVI